MSWMCPTCGGLDVLSDFCAEWLKNMVIPAEEYENEPHFSPQRERIPFACVYVNRTDKTPAMKLVLIQDTITKDFLGWTYCLGGADKDNRRDWSCAPLFPNAQEAYENALRSYAKETL